MATGNIGVNNQWWNIHTGAVQIAQNVTLSNYPGYTSANSSPQWRVSMSKKVTFWSQVHPASFKPFSPTLAASQTKLRATTSAASAQVSQNNTRKNSKKLNIFSLWQGRLFQYFFQARSFVGRGKPASLSTGGELCQAKSSEEQVRIPSFSISCEMCRKRVECADTKCVEIFLKLYQMIGKSENGTKDHGLEWLKMADLPILPLSGIVGYPTTQHLAKEDFFIFLHHCQWYIGLHHAFGHDNHMTIMIVTIMALVCIYS